MEEHGDNTRRPSRVIDTTWLESGIACISIDSPPANQLDAAGRAELRSALTLLVDEEALRVLVLQGADGRFSAGNDIRELRELGPDSWRAFTADWDEVYRQLREFPVPVVAAVEGYAYGGGFEMMLNCDLRVVSEDVALACTAASLGLVMSTHSLVRQVGWARGRELFYTARKVGAEEARDLGLVNAVAPAGELDGAALALARKVAARSPQAIRRSKVLMERAETLRRGEHDPLQRDAFVELSCTAEHRDAVAEFLDRRGSDAAAENVAVDPR